MPRMPRVQVEGALYYVTSRGDNNKDIFKDEEDFKAYINLLAKYKLQYEFKLFAYVLLSNHFHLLIEPKKDTTISEIMHDLNSSYTKYFNAKNKRKGHLLQERFKLNLIEKEQYLLSMVAYIHSNPQKLNLGLEKSNYQYSSYSNYLQRSLNIDLNFEYEREEISSKLNGGSFIKFLDQNLEKEQEMLEKKLHKNKILGSDEFKQGVKDSIEEQKQKVVQKPIINRKIMVGSMVLIVIFVGVNIGLYFSNKQLKEDSVVAIAKVQKDLNIKVQEEIKKTKQNVQEYYRANDVSYRAMQKRLEIEKNKVKNLEGKFKEGGNNE